jgi:uncharacterized protein (DUF1499 family)
MLVTLLSVAAAVAALALGAGQAGMLGGQPPSQIGVSDGRLPPPKKSPNNVHSQAASWGPEFSHTRIDPLPVQTDGSATLTRLRGLIEATPGAVVVKSDPDYLYVQYTTKWMKFVDDAEFWFDPTAQKLQVRSASRLGDGDMGVNRARIEDLRRRLAQP